MRLPIHRFETRVARRVLLLFLLCAMLPVAVFAALGYARVRANLGEQTWERLFAAGKTLSMSVTERLLLLKVVLEGDAATAGRPDDPTLGGLFTALDEPDTPGAAHLPDLDRAVGGESPAAADRVRLIVAEDPQEGAEIHLLRTGEGRPPRRARVSPDYLDAALQGLPPYATACVLASTPGGDLAPVLGCEHGEIPAFSGLGPNGNAVRMSWESSSERRLGVAREMFLASEFGSPSWIVVVSEPEARVLAPAASFTRTFLLIVVLCGLGVTLASNLQIHRVLDPITKLRVGTERVARGDLATRVDLSTGDEFEHLSSSFNTMVERLHRQVRALEATQHIDASILKTHEIRDIVMPALRHAPDVVLSDRRRIALLEEEGATIFELDADSRSSPLRSTTSRSAIERMVAAPADVSRDGGFHLTVPMRVEGRLRGALCFERAAPPFDEVDRTYAERLANHVAVAISNAELFEELGQLHFGTLRALASAIDAKSRWTAGHSSRVTQLSLSVARQLKLGQQDLTTLQRGTILHDIGKIAVPAAILDKNGPLTEEEWKVLREHPAYGVKIVGHIRQYTPVLPIIGQHHERWDGSGYPGGLAGEEIDFFARLVGVCDTFDAMTSDRPYRAGWSPERARDVIRAERGTLFDPRIVDAFLELDELAPAEELDDRRPLAASA